MKICHIKIFAVLALLLFGCSKEQANVEKPNASQSKVGVLLSVGGRELTLANLNDKIEMMVRVRNLSAKPPSKKELKSWKSNLKATYPNVFIMQAVVADYAREKGIAIDKSTTAYYQKKAIKRLNSREIRNYKQLRKKVGSFAKLLDERIAEEALLNEVRQHIAHENPTNFPPEYVKARCQQLKDYNARMALTNAVIYARATNVWEQLKSGADFGELARKYSEIEAEAEDKGELGVIGLQQLQDEPKFAQVLRELKVGEFSAPVEADNGVSIIRMDSKDVEKDEYGFSRIYFRLPMLAKVFDEQEMEKQLQKEYNERIVGEKIEQMVRSAKVEYFNKKTGGKK